jgi:hypothetical protein
MFDTLFSRPCAIQRHRSGFLATERTVTVQVVEIAITPQLVPSERLRGAETGPFHHGEPLHTRR